VEEIATVYELPGWHPYQDLNAYTDHSLPRIGQIHRWYFLKLKPETNINLDKATDKEFSDWRWTSFEEAIAITSTHKQPIYHMLHTNFKSYRQI
jgi:8-oxo-dGTP pyrophosphatase MutT (NUDIX family)